MKSPTVGLSRSAAEGAGRFGADHHAAARRGLRNERQLRGRRPGGGHTCGFIVAAVQESLDAIGEALAENGRVIVTGCLGARTDHGRAWSQGSIRRCWRVTGPHAADEVLAHVHAHLPKPHDPLMDLVPPAASS